MSQAHFDGKYEVEFKYRLQDRDTFLARLHSLPHQVMLKDNVEFDRYYDTQAGSLAQESKHLCLREMRPSDIKLWIVKGPASQQCQATRIDNIDSAADMLETMGYEVVLRLTKTRSIYFIDQYHVTVDNLEGLGDFAELAIMTDDETQLAHHEQGLLKLAKQLGLRENDRETNSYRELIMNSQTVSSPA
ncbi:class IV adenylate cyclase [Shewanella insulae]|uniref:class IV adenylate cyclase n=1 Tax=Shewanella insulae TaxID=2681496 RepID=UPI001EFD1771|nr:class IV adenylate cyclase [Shewanella insulae]MCG9737424.1 class IV adenylate cyclase [Shewanella insulae]